MALPLQDANQVTNGQRTPATQWGEYNNLSFLVQQALAKVQTALPVRIVSCTNAGGLSPVGMVDVIPMVGQTTAEGILTPHSTVYNLPYVRIQGGSNGIIIDPEPGDIGIAVFASRDISVVKSTKADGAPGSWRQFSFSDGMYIGGMLNGTPAQYVQFNSTGIRIHSPIKVKLDAPDVEIDCATFELSATTSATITTPTLTVNGATILNGTLTSGGIGGGAATFTGTITATGDITGAGTHLHTHIHSGVQSGTNTTGGPV